MGRGGSSEHEQDFLTTRAPGRLGNTMIDEKTVMSETRGKNKTLSESEQLQSMPNTAISALVIAFRRHPRFETMPPRRRRSRRLLCVLSCNGDVN